MKIALMPMRLRSSDSGSDCKREFQQEAVCLGELSRFRATHPSRVIIIKILVHAQHNTTPPRRTGSPGKEDGNVLGHLRGSRVGAIVVHHRAVVPVTGTKGVNWTTTTTKAHPCSAARYFLPRSTSHKTPPPPLPLPLPLPLPPSFRPQAYSACAMPMAPPGK